MKKILALGLVFSFLTFSTASANVNVPQNTQVFIRLNGEHSSTNVSAGQKLSGRISDDVFVSGVKVFKAGDSAYLEVTNIEKPRAWGTPGKIIIAYGRVTDAKGIERKIEVAKNITGKEKEWTKITCAVGAYVIVGLPLCFFGFVKGEDATAFANVDIEGFTIGDFKF